MNDRGIYKNYLNFFPGNRHLRHKRWNEVKKVILDYKVETVLEFGCGVSTWLFHNLGLYIVTLETDYNFLEAVTSHCSSRVEPILWDNVYYKSPNTYDLSLIDGILPREPQLSIALECSSILCIDDFAGRIKNSFEPKLSHLERIDSGETIMAIFKNSFKN